MKAAIDLLRTNERKAPGQINFGEPNHRNRLSPSKRPLVQLFFILRNFFFQKKERWLIYLLRFGVCFGMKILLELLLLFWCFHGFFFSRLLSYLKWNISLGSLENFIDVARKGASPGPSVPILHLEGSLILLMLCLQPLSPSALRVGRWPRTQSGVLAEMFRT